MSEIGTTATAPAPWLDHLRREATRFAEVTARSPLRAHVPAYPDFTVHSLAAHIGRGLRLFDAIVTTGSAENLAIEVPDGAEIADWVLAGLEPLIAVLGEVPPDKPVPFPHQAGDRPAGLHPRPAHDASALNSRAHAAVLGHAA